MKPAKRVDSIDLSGIRKMFDMVGENSINLALGEPDFNTPLHIREAVKEALLAGLGVSVISRHAIRRELQAGTVHEVSIKGIKMERHFYLIYLRQTELSHAHKVFVEFLKNFRPDK